MDILHMKYALEIAEAGSITKAAKALSISPSNLSRGLKELEDSLGVALFIRRKQGMFLTPEGEDFVRCSKSILPQFEELEKESSRQRFSISVPRASYISEAFARFSKGIGPGPAEIYYNETNSDQAIKNILAMDYKLGIIRYGANYERYFEELLGEKGLDGQLVAEFRYVLLMSEGNPLAARREIRFADLRPFIEVAHADPFVPSLPLSAARKLELPDDIERRILVFERGSQFNVLSENPDAFMWVSPVPERLLRGYGLIQRPCPDNTKVYRDVLIHRKGYVFSDLDRLFVSELRKSARGLKGAGGLR